MEDLQTLLNSRIHENRFVALVMLVNKYKKANYDNLPSKSQSGTDAIIEQDHPDSPVLAYLRWFSSLGIDLTAGDGESTILTNPDKKIGRNEPCPCGSGKKYKKCCGN